MDCSKEGSGQLRYADGSIYNGEFKDDMPNGFGKKVLSDGSWY